MIISFKDIELSTLQFNEIEVLRNLRNTHHNKFIDTKIISSKQQEIWFENIDYSSNLFLTIKQKETICGFIYYHDIDIINKSTKTAILVNENNIEAHSPSLCAIMLSDFIFKNSPINQLHSKIKLNNIKAIEFNKKIGFQIIAPPNNNIIDTICTKERFYEKNLKIINYIKKDLNILLENNDLKYTFLKL